MIGVHVTDPYKNVLRMGKKPWHPKILILSQGFDLIENWTFFPLV